MFLYGLRELPCFSIQINHLKPIGLLHLKNALIQSCRQECFHSSLKANIFKINGFHRTVTIFKFGAHIYSISVQLCSNLEARASESLGQAQVPAQVQDVYVYTVYCMCMLNLCHHYLHYTVYTYTSVPLGFLSVRLNHLVFGEQLPIVLGTVTDFVR